MGPPGASTYGGAAGGPPRPIAAGVFEPTFGLVLRPEIAALAQSLGCPGPTTAACRAGMTPTQFTQNVFDYVRTGEQIVGGWLWNALRPRV